MNSPESTVQSPQPIAQSPQPSESAGSGIPFRARLNHWATGAINASVQGGAVAVKAFLGTAAANGAGLPVPALNLKQAGCVLLFGAAYHFLEFITNNPLPVVAERI